MRLAIISRRVLLADDALARASRRACSTASSLVLHHAADRNAGPVGDDAGHRLGVDRRQDQRRFALQRCRACPARSRSSASSFSRSIGSAGVGVGRRLATSPPSPMPAVDRLVAAAQLARAAPAPCRRCAFSSCQRFSSPARRSRSAPSFSSTSALARADVDADRGLAVDDAGLDLERLDAPPAVLDLGRHRVLADRDARAGGVEQAHRLVGQLARRDVAVRQLAPPPRSPRRAAAPGGASPARVATPRSIRIAFGSSGSCDLHDLEAARQRRVLLDVLLVLGPGGRADRAQRCRAPAPA